MSEDKAPLYVDIDDAVQNSYSDNLTTEDRDKISKILKQSISIHSSMPNNKYYIQPKEALDYLTKDVASKPKVRDWLFLPTIQNLFSSVLSKILTLVIIIISVYFSGIIDKLPT